MRIAIFGFLHESNAFLSVHTAYQDFQRAPLTCDAAMIQRWKGAYPELGGMIAGCEEQGLEIAGGMAALAIPSGTITVECYERLMHDLVTALRNALPGRGVLIALHGATVSERYPDVVGPI